MTYTIQMKGVSITIDDAIRAKIAKDYLFEMTGTKKPGRKPGKRRGRPAVKGKPKS